ncbi:MAG: hypothetical protein ACK5T0_06120 [Vampirovibrionales bacterium]
MKALTSQSNIPVRLRSQEALPTPSHREGGVMVHDTKFIQNPENIKNL